MHRQTTRILVSLVILSILVWKFSNSTQQQMFGRLINRVERAEKWLALTFDDGPNPIYTQRIIEILQSHDVRATFFLTGAQIAKHPALTQELVARGHEIGNHSYSHTRMVFKSPDFIEDEIEATNTLIRRAGHTGEIYFRPPYGKKLALLPYYLAQQNITTITWDVAAESHLPAEASAKEIADYSVQHSRPGSIILLHVMYPSRENSLAAVAQIIRRLRQKGYEFVTLSTLLTQP